MSSEAITRNDLTAILNEVLPPAPSEYRKLLWTNPNPTSSFTAQTITVPDISEYDELEIVTRGGSITTGNTFKYPVAQLLEGNVHWLSFIGQGATGLPSINGRPFNVVSSTQIHFELGGYWNTAGNNSGLATAGVPLKIYGIKYERVAPPQIDGWDYVTSVTGSNTVTFTDLATQGYSEVYVNDSSGFGGGYSPVVALPTALVWGGFYGGVNGLLHGVDITKTSIKGRYGVTDSTNYLSTMTFYLYAR